MKIVIVGNGVAGTFSAQNMRNLDNKVEIEIISEEKYHYYTRIRLPELISEKTTIEEMIVFKEDWYKKNNIKMLLGKKITKIEPDNKRLFVEKEKASISYDKLIIATGSTPSIPPIKNAKEMIGKGVFTLRNVDNALEIKKYIKIKGVKKAIIIGGGLLGLELARQIRNCNLDTTVVEIFPRLLPRQLDVDCADMLKEKIEEMGIKVILNVTTEEILGTASVKGIKLKDGRKLDADLVLIQAGIVPTIDLAKDAKININKGIIVDEHLKTSAKDVYAVGDCIEFKSQIWGIIPACMDQSKIIATSVLDKKGSPYNGTVPKNTLKIIGINLTSIGVFDPTGEKDPMEWEILKKVEKKNKNYQKLVLKDNTLNGAILFGERKNVTFVSQNIETKINKDELRKMLEVYTWVCSNCGNEYDEGKMDIIFEDLEDNWTCSDCKGPKSGFEKNE